MRKYTSLIVAALFVFSAYAENNMQSRVETLEKQMREAGSKTAFDGYGAHMANARPSKEDSNWFIKGGLLYMRPNVGGTEFAFTSATPTLTYPISGSTKKIDFDTSVGFTVGLGYNFNFDGWDIQSNYARLSSGGSKSASVNCNGVVIPLRAAICPFPEDTVQQSSFWATRAKSKYNIEYNTVDLQMGRSYFLSSTLSMRPSFGIKAAFIDLKQATRYCGGSDDHDDVFCDVQMISLGSDVLSIRETSDFSGIGPEVSMQSKWFLGKGFSFFAEALGALLYGYFDVDRNEKLNSNDTSRIDLSANTHRLVPMAQLQSGVAYDIFFDDDHQHIGFRFGYDVQYYWRINQMIEIYNPSTLRMDRYSEDFSLHGLLFDIRWDF
ncbi:MAG: MOMP family protein [Chlamydiales bacterium]|nr:MOMP family protein [Chlamydiales bacterium]